MSLARLEAELEALRGAGRPDEWALAAYRLGVARSEAATDEAGLRAAMELLDRAGRTLDAARSPVEHARILTAVGSCRRRLDEPGAAAALFDRAADLLAGRVAAAQEAAALVNCGLAATEAGRPGDAAAPLGRALALVDGADDDESLRVRGAAHLNRAQAHQAAGSPHDLERAVEDYRVAADCFDHDGPQRALALHGMGSALLDLAAARGSSVVARGPAGAPGATATAGDSPGDHRDTVAQLATEAVTAFRASLQILTLEAFPFRHAVARHSLALAYERRDGPLDILRAAECAEAALGVIDPRLQGEHWQVTATTLARLEAAVAERTPLAAPGTPLRRFVLLIDGAEDAERVALLRDRLARTAAHPDLRRRRDCTALATAAVGAGPATYERFMRATIPVLMELPDPLLDAMCSALCEAHADSGAAEVYDEVLDRVIHDLLFGPQRVRMRDLLEARGWVRP